MAILDTLFNRFGKPEINLDTKGSFVSFTGKRLGFLIRDSVYTYKGTHIGWFENGVLRDPWGNVVGFGDNPNDYPMPLLPFKQFKPLASFPGLEPLRPVTSIPPIKPLKSFNWSVATPLALFWGNQ